MVDIYALKMFCGVWLKFLRLYEIIDDYFNLVREMLTHDILPNLGLSKSGL